MGKKSGHLRKRLNVFRRKQSETKTVEAEISGSLCYAMYISFNTTPNAMKLILNEHRLTKVFIHIKYIRFGIITREI